MATSEPVLTWEALAELHENAARAAARVPFPQHRLLDADRFAKLCERTHMLAHLCNGPVQPVLEDLHRLRLVVPLFVTPKGSDRREIARLTAYEPWATHGTAADAEGWTELLYHPFQLWLVDLAARYFFAPWTSSPAFRESLAERRADLGRHAQVAAREVAAVREPSVRTRQARFYAALPALLLADAAIGPQLRGVLRMSDDEVAAQRQALGRRPTPKQRERYEAAWERWSRGALRVRGPELLARDRAKLVEFAREAQLVGESIDPLRRWSDLTALVPWDEREKLEGSALAAHRFHELARLLGELMRRVDATPRSRRVGPSERVFVASRYGLCATPAVTWFVSSKAEQRALAALSAARGHVLERRGVVVKVLDGGELAKASFAIDVARRLGAPVFVLAECDGKRIAKWARRLLEDRRLATEQLFWSDPTFEKANFTKAERRQAKAECGSTKRARVVAWLVERYLVPELLRDELASTRPLVGHVRTVLDAARRRERVRPRSRASE